MKTMNYKLIIGFPGDQVTYYYEWTEQLEEAIEYHLASGTSVEAYEQIWQPILLSLWQLKRVI